MKHILLAFVFLQIYTVNSQVIWSADPDRSASANSFFRRFDSGNYPQDFCYERGDEQGVTASNVTTYNDPVFGKVWKIIKPRNRKRAEFARTEGDINYFAPKDGDDIYIGWRWKITASPNINNEVAVWQWKGERGTDFHQNYPLNMEYDGDLSLNAFGPDWYGGNFPSNRRAILWKKPVPENTWVSLVVHIKVSKEDKDARNGFVEFWFNGVKQTLNRGTSSLYKVNLSGDAKRAYHRTDDGVTVYPKWGVYNKNSCAFAANAFIDELKIGNTLVDAMPSEANVNQPPAVAITSPSNNQVFTIGEEITLSADATDADGNLDKVNFKLNDAYYSTDRTAPYQGTFTPTEPGTYKIAARAFDLDAEVTEVFVTVTVNTANQAPAVAVTSPSNNQVFSIGETISLAAIASDVDGNLDKVNFKVNGAYYSTDRTAPYEGTFTPTEAGTYTIAARAFDLNAEATEVFVTITVDATLSIGDLSNNDVLSGLKIFPVPANSVLNVVGVPQNSQISIFDISGKLIKNMTTPKTSSQIDISNFSKGLYFLKLHVDASQSKTIKFTKN